MLMFTELEKFSKQIHLFLFDNQLITDLWVIVRATP